MINVTDSLFALLYPESHTNSVLLHDDMDREDLKGVFGHACASGLGPLLYYCIAAQGLSACVPARILQNLARSFEGTGVRNLERLRELERIRVACAEKHIPSIPLKGVHLVTSVYGNLALRPMGDTDILVRKEDLAEVDTIMLSLGYASCVSNIWKAKHMIDRAYSRLSPSLNLSVEMHWNLLGECGPIKLE